MVISTHTGNRRRVNVIKWIFSGAYILGLLLFVGAGLVSRLSKRKLLSRVLSTVSTFLMASWATYTFVLLIRAGVSPTLFDVFYTIIVALNLVFSSVLLILAIFGELDLCPDSNDSNESTKDN